MSERTINDYSDEELAAELAARKKFREDFIRNARLKRHKLITEHKATLLLFVEHNRTSCDDASPKNAGRNCPRCLLLTDEYLDESIDILITFDRKPISE